MVELLRKPLPGLTPQFEAGSHALDAEQRHTPQNEWSDARWQIHAARIAASCDSAIIVDLRKHICERRGADRVHAAGEAALLQRLAWSG